MLRNNLGGGKNFTSFFFPMEDPAFASKLILRKILDLQFLVKISCKNSNRERQLNKL